MEIVGRGFIARYMAPVADRHPHVTLLAAGVSSTRTADPADYARETALVRAELARCRARGSTLVFLSSASSSLYGQPAEPAAEELDPHPRDAYGRHKLSLEEEVRTGAPDWLVLRLSHVVGPGQRAHQLLPSLVRQVRAGQVTLHRGAARDLVDVADVRTALEALLRQNIRNEVVNVASGFLCPVERIVAGLEARLGVTARKELVQANASGAPISIRKLRRLLANWPFDFGADYPERLLERYTQSYDQVAHGAAG
ncbi:NAD-dependent epimerase/dehydratase family protein [Streptomyces sp. NPDC018019]|uniref:NAD-dependent epimerase/dehydratase family protein n=1 Tax=Streptomyces sp. NPDC018019 TaxID=3365030 RepID=UPI0037A1B76A